MLSGNCQNVCLFSRKLDPKVFNHSDISEALSAIARKSRLPTIQILIDDPKALIDNNHKLLNLYRRLPSKISIQRITIEPETDYEFMIVDQDKLWLQHNEGIYTGFANYNAKLEAKKFKELFHELWKNSQSDTRLRQLYL